MTIALIDADIAAFRAAAGGTTIIDWGDGETTASVDPHAAAEAAIATINAWMKLAKCDTAVCCFTGRNNFRNRILPSYKAGRVGKSKPQGYYHVVKRVSEEFDTRLVEGLEADDLMGIMLTNGRYGNAVCVTLDKDLRTVPGLHLNPLKETKPVPVTVEEADYWWLTQTITGDPTDGYKGLPRVGAVGAVKILGASPALAVSLWPRVTAAYLKARLTIPDALVQARVARILRATDYDRETKSVLLWHPRDAVPLCIKHISA